MKLIKEIIIDWLRQVLDYFDDRYVVREVYMDKIDFECELGNAAGCHLISADIEELTKRRRCLPTCGIVEVEVRYIKTVVEESE